MTAKAKPKNSRAFALRAIAGGMGGRCTGAV